jgi:competence protein ComEA
MGKNNQWAGIVLLAGMILSLLVVRFTMKDRASTSGSPLPVVVEVQGDVKKPGVYLLKGPSATLANALEAAGTPGEPPSTGTSTDLYPRELRTGQLIRITGRTELGRKVEILRMDAAARLTLGLKLSLSDATEQELLLVPQMKPEYASAIVVHRDQRPWRSMDELVEIQGVGPKTVETWKNYLDISAEF